MSDDHVGNETMFLRAELLESAMSAGVASPSPSTTRISSHVERLTGVGFVVYVRPQIRPRYSPCCRGADGLDQLTPKLPPALHC